MHTKDKLAEALREAGLDAMAEKAATGYYHDFLSPLVLPDVQLLADLNEAFRHNPSPKIRKLIARHLNGDFDANAEESEAWMNSEEGQDAMRRLVEGK